MLEVFAFEENENVRSINSKIIAYFEKNDKWFTFVMAKNDKRKINVREKFGDYLMDISKYVFTAVMLSTLFDDLLTAIWMKY